MRFCVLASGSKGNSTYVEVNGKKYLIDLGVTYTYLLEKLKEINVNPNDIEGIFITHLHGDHIYGLAKFLKMHNTIVYLSEEMHKNIKINISNYEYLETDTSLDDLSVEVIHLSHDSECRGYILSSNNKELVYLTDTGYINTKHHVKLVNKNAYVFESNHDIELLMKSKYPHKTKVRILGDMGHISNKDCAYYLSKFVGDRTQFIVLAHLSEENNIPELALKNIQDNVKYEGNLLTATQNDRTGVMEL